MGSCFNILMYYQIPCFLSLKKVKIGIKYYRLDLQKTFGE